MSNTDKRELRPFADLGNRWRIFGTVLLEPLFVALFVLTGLAAFALYCSQTGSFLFVPLTTLVGLLSGLAGAVLDRRWM